MESLADLALGTLLKPARPLMRTGVRLLSARTGRQLAQLNRDREGQQRIFADRLAEASRCEGHTTVGLTAHLSYEEFRRTIPLRTYEDFHPWVERMRAGEADVLAPGRCEYYAVSSGTTAGRTKYLPINPGMLAHFRRAGLDSLLFYSHRTGSAQVFDGKHLFLGGSTALQAHTSPAGFTSWAGDLSGITALHMPAWVERHLYEPGRDLALVSDWPTKLRAIAERTRSRKITLVAGIPSWLLILAEAVRAGTPHASLDRIWPHLECLLHGGVPIAPYVETLRDAFGQKIRFHEVFPASEGFIAAQDAGPDEGLRLLARHGVFYEFLPLRDYTEDRRAELGSLCRSLEEVETDTDYVLVMTAPSGLVRYVIGDVVRFISTCPARLVYAGRTRLQLSAFGEHVTERDLTLALAEAARKLGVQVAHFHVAPRFADPTQGIARGAHAWCLELQEGCRIEDLDTARTLLDQALCRSNDDYEAKRLGGGLTPPEVHVVPAGTFGTWLKRRGKWGGQNKVPRCSSDRSHLEALLEISQSGKSLP